MLIKDLSDTMHRKAKEVVAIYQDDDSSYKNENAVFAGNALLKADDSKVPNMMDNFYEKLDEIDVSLWTPPFQPAYLTRRG